MISGSMNKLRAPDCSHCEGLGQIRVARSLENAREATAKPGLPPAGPGFMWLSCQACNGAGRR